jgi:hypothetical protein
MALQIAAAVRALPQETHFNPEIGIAVHAALRALAARPALSASSI